MAKITFSNPRLQAEFADWPLGGSKRGVCRFAVCKDKKGVRASRTTTGKPKYTTYGGDACIADGSDGRTYVLRFAGKGYDHITVYRSDFLNVSREDFGRDAAVFPDDPEFSELSALIRVANAPKYRFTGKDINTPEQRHPLAGLECALLKSMGMTHAGYDVVVLVDKNSVFDAYTKDYPGGREVAVSHFERNGWVVGGFVEVEANMKEELVLVV